MVLHEIHKKGYSDWNDNWHSCQCSYCIGNNKLKFGLNIPSDILSFNSWWIIKYWKGRYIRWTNSWIKKFKR